MSMPKQRQQRPDEELQAASDHLGYEVEMLFGALGELERLHRERLDGEEPTISANNAFLESWAIHLRNLHNFFFGEAAAWPDDMLAKDYFAADEWERLRPNRQLGREIERVAKEIVHLTYARVGVTAEMKQWNLGELTDWLGREAIRPFVEQVPRRRVLPNFKTRCTLAMSFRPLILVP
jgi:hypothetical protein